MKQYKEINGTTSLHDRIQDINYYTPVELCCLSIPVSLPMPTLSPTLSTTSGFFCSQISAKVNIHIIIHDNFV